MKKSGELMKNIYVITSGKGGVGKSTITAYLGVELCKLGKKVLLIDMDEGLRSLDLMLDVSSHTLFDVSDIIKGNCNVNQAVIPVKKCSNLYLLPAPVTVNSLNSPKGMKILCEKLASYFDYILIDSPAGVGKGFINAISGAKNAFVVANPDPVSVRDASYVAKLLRENNINNARLIVNKFDGKLVKKGVFYNIDEIIDSTTLQLIGVVPFDVELIKSFNNCTENLYVSPALEAVERITNRILGNKVPLGIWYIKGMEKIYEYSFDCTRR